MCCSILFLYSAVNDILSADFCQHLHRYLAEYLFVVTCASLSLSNGGVSYNKSPVNGRYPVDTRASFSCTRGYSLSGSSSRTCQTSGNWNQGIPTCNQSNWRISFTFLFFLTKNWNKVADDISYNLIQMTKLWESLV